MSATIIGKNQVSESEVFQVPAVPFTRTFHPVHHREVICAVKDSVKAVGLDIVKSQYVLARDGLQMFGVYDLSQGNSEMCWSIGVRNSMDRSLSLGITGGSRVFVCENLAFSGEFIAFRRHTNGLTLDELEFLAFRSMRKMIQNLTAFQAWHESLKRFPLDEIHSKILLVEILTNNVIPASKFHRFQELYGNVYQPDMWGFHEAVTDTLKGTNLISLPQKNQVLNGIINTYIDSLHSVEAHQLGAFYEQRSANHQK